MDHIFFAWIFCREQSLLLKYRAGIRTALCCFCIVVQIHTADEMMAVKRFCSTQRAKRPSSAVMVSMNKENLAYQWAEFMQMGNTSRSLFFFLRLRPLAGILVCAVPAVE